MNKITTELIKMYYVPPFYYWIDDDMYKYVHNQLIIRLDENKDKYYNSIKNIRTKIVEKGSDYNEYKSDLIRIILLKYAHDNPNKKSIDLLEDIFNKWKENKNIRDKHKNIILERSIFNIVKYEKNINNIEQIMMSINLNILENYTS